MIVRDCIFFFLRWLLKTLLLYFSWIIFNWLWNSRSFSAWLGRGIRRQIMNSWSSNDIKGWGNFHLNLKRAQNTFRIKKDDFCLFLKKWNPFYNFKINIRDGLRRINNTLMNNAFQQDAHWIIPQMIKSKLAFVIEVQYCSIEYRK